MTWNRLTWTTLLTCALTLFGCPPPVVPPDAPDASTPDASNPDASTGYEWDGGYVPLEETGNPWTDTGPYAPCTFTVAAGGTCTGFSTFDLSACDRESLANADDPGHYVLNTRSNRSPPVFSAAILRLGSDGATPYLNHRPVTGQASDGNARFYSISYTTATGIPFTKMIATCQAPRAPEFTGCTATCRNGKLVGTETFESVRMKWREGEAEASGLELVSESHVDIGYPVDVYVTQGHAYVVSATLVSSMPGGLTVFDVRNPSAPVKVKTVQLENDTDWNGVWAKGNALYVASFTRGVLVFDISDPADPRLLRHLPTTSSPINVHTLFGEGNRLYAAAPGLGALLFDVTTPTEPVELGRYPSAPHDMFAMGDRLYISGGPGYLVADMSNPADIRPLGTFNYPLHYPHQSVVGTFGGRTIAFEGGEGHGEHLRVLDVTDPANIVKIGWFQLRPSMSIHNMVLVGKKLYLTWYQEGVRVLDVSNPTQPTQVAYYNTFRDSDTYPGEYLPGAMGIRVPGDGYIYVVDTQRGLLLLRER
jgi:hypothetical protein